MTKYYPNQFILPDEISAVLFDLDGVLLDSKNNMYLSWREVKKEFNLKVLKSKKIYDRKNIK